MRCIILIVLLFQINFSFSDVVPLYWWKPNWCTDNFGDELSRIVVKKLSGKNVERSKGSQKKLLAIGSILHFANSGDVIWGAGINGKISLSSHKFKHLDVRCVRGPLTRKYLMTKGIFCPKIYGDPALLLPRLYPELKRKPQIPFIVIPNLNEIDAYKNVPNLVLPNQDPFIVIKEILKAKLVISSSLHGLIVAEAFGIPAQLIRIKPKESIFKYADYYMGTGRNKFTIAHSVKEAIKLGGQSPFICNLDALEKSFPEEFFFKSKALGQ